jgi:hypothetical protein
MVWSSEQGNTEMTFTKWLETFIAEKGIDTDEEIILTGKTGNINFMTIGTVVEAIKSAPVTEQAGIKTMIVKIDFRNGDVCHYFRHLAQALAR